MYYYLVSPIKIIRADAHSFTYAYPERLPVGALVVIEVGSTHCVGIIMSAVVKPEFTVKEIVQILDDAPVPLPLIQTALWMSSYYHTHLATVWQTILPRGLTKKRRHSPSRATSPQPSQPPTTALTTDQRAAITAIDDMLPGSALLHGVTGSGKTRVYIELARQLMDEDLSSIILVPEIALTSQLVNEFAKYFDNIVLTHSRQTEAERHVTWQHVINSRDPLIVIGPRSALFMPVQQLGLVVIDECHEPSFKQEQSPRYSALRTAAILARQHEAKLVLGSATPAVSDYFLAKTTGRPIIAMPTPARSDAVKPRISLVDMTKRTNFTQHFFLSDQLLSAITGSLNDGNQALIFHNRRGTAAITLCEQCGWNAGCPRCFVPLTLHADQHQLLCHICGFTTPVPTSCPECHHADIIHKGLGTKRIEAELRKLFPTSTIARFDADTSTNDAADKRYEELKNGSIDIIIGTQVIAKGLDLPYLRTVGVIQADAGLALPDFSSSERTFQLLAQVVGRVGRSHHATDVIVQTFQPDHPAIRDGLAQNYADFYTRTIAQRRATDFLPFVYLLKLTCVYKTEAAAIRNAKKLAQTLRAAAPADVHILGPTPAFYERVRDTYRWQLILKSPRRSDLVSLLDLVPPAHWQAELDPTSLL